MIRVRRDASLIPDNVLEAAKKKTEELEALGDADARAAFIKKHSKIWKAFSAYLAEMSHKKCWYSESLEPHSLMDVDHFRPKSQYQWLAFAWENFCLSAERANRRTTDETTGEVVGKGDKFPLVPGSSTATWDHRCVDQESPMLLDPTKLDDVRLIEVADDGTMRAIKYYVGTKRKRVDLSIELYGLNLPNLTEARKRVMRGIQERYEMLEKLALAVANAEDNVADNVPVMELAESLRDSTRPHAPYAAAARAQLTG